MSIGIKVRGKGNKIHNNTVSGADVGYDIEGEHNDIKGNKYFPSLPKLKPLVVAIKKPIAGFVKVWHVVGILFTIIVFPFAKDIAVYHYKQYHESTSQEKIQQSQEKHKIDNQK
jgi:hypothetical protein